MTKLKKPVTFETTFGFYVVDDLLGEGGAGRVYGGSGPDGTPVALKVHAETRASTDKRRRFKNELPFLVRNEHCNISTMIEPRCGAWCGDRGSVLRHAEVSGIDAEEDLTRRWINPV